MKIGYYFLYVRKLNLKNYEFSLGIYTLETEDSEGVLYNTLNIGLIGLELSIFKKP